MADEEALDHPPVDDELARIEAAYAEVARRDTSAEAERWHWKLCALASSGLCALLVCAVLWLTVMRKPVQAFVQVVQVDDVGRLIQLGMPQDVLAYTPEDGVWLELIAGWVRRVRWHGMDPVLAKDEWRWVHHHTCSDARRHLQVIEEELKPFVVGKRQVGVELKSITRTAAPRSYQALWTEMTTEGSQPPKKQQWTGTFTTGRMRLTTPAAVLFNPLGICIAGFDVTAQP